MVGLGLCQHMLVLIMHPSTIDKNLAEAFWIILGIFCGFSEPLNTYNLSDPKNNSQALVRSGCTTLQTMANKTVMRLHVNDCYKCKKIALHSVTEIEGIDSLSFNMKESTLTVMGDADPVCVANMLRKKFRCAEVVYAGVTPPPPPPKPKPETKPETKPEPKPEPEPTPAPAPPPAPAPAPDPPKPVPVPSKPDPAPAPAPAPDPHPPRPKCCHVCGVWCCPQCSGCSCRPVQYNPPCSSCSCRPDILWPRYNPPCANPGEVWYVWNEERQESCTVM